MNALFSKILTFTFILFLGISCCKDSDEGMECIEDLNEDCICTTQYEPVCGCNGKTYGNACNAQCAGITDYAEGACE